MRGNIVIDAGVEHIHVQTYENTGNIANEFIFNSGNPLAQEFKDKGINDLLDRKSTPYDVYITGKLADIVKKTLGQGVVINSSAALWSSAQQLINNHNNKDLNSLAIIDISASGYTIIGVDSNGQLRNDCLIVNPKCGAGSGTNISRVLQKLSVSCDDVDNLLSAYIGKENKLKRCKLNVRADRCGVFSSSATISDKNQGIPLDFALAVTLKSEVMKVCKKLPDGFNRIYLTGGIFLWKFARDCAEDYLTENNVKEIRHDSSQTLFLDGVRYLVDSIGINNIHLPEERLREKQKLVEYPSFISLKNKYESSGNYRRLGEMAINTLPSSELEEIPVNIGLDVGSTMAKIVIANSNSGEPLYLGSYSNSGDTIETIKKIFSNLKNEGVTKLNVVNLGITGSARYQVQEALRQIYPQISQNISVLVENYAHARGSIEYAKKHIRLLHEQGVNDVNEDFFIVVDIGGEDTKLTTVSLEKGELFDNAMNVKCSAGTGSLMDTLASLFKIESVSKASAMAFQAEKAFYINATCAVFLIENARRLQAQRINLNEILASAEWAIIENMARTLWSQIDLPKNAIVMLHGQTMLSEPLPLAVTHRLMEHIGSTVYAVVPPNPGHMACMGLIKDFESREVNKSQQCVLDDFINRKFEKRIITCKGAVCGDKNARCNRTSLKGTDDTGKYFHFSLGGCSAINEFLMTKDPKKKKAVTDTYKEIWDYINNKLPKSDESNRLVIPRSFVVSEWAGLFSNIFLGAGIPVHVDNVTESDIIEAQPFLNIDTCAPQMGAIGQYRRLARNRHGIILVPQIEYLPSSRASAGRTCTINQGGGLVAKNIAEVSYPESRFHIFNIDFSALDEESIASQMYEQMEVVFNYYDIDINQPDFQKIVSKALKDYIKQKDDVEEKVADILEKALSAGRPISVVVGREYILHPGIYDSHVGRLLRDKGIAAIPAYAINFDIDDEYSHIYWRNPQRIVSMISAIAKKKFHEKLSNPRLKEIFRHIETQSNDKLLPVVQVTTFRCGADSVTLPFVEEIMKKRPFLLIQSDAGIKELAHLENRVNTYIKQLELGLNGKLKGINGESFEIHVLDNFVNKKALNKKNDVLYFPTLSDNRMLTAALRSGGYSVIDNYDDDTYDLTDIVKRGRDIAGDSVCTPMAAVYGDLVKAIEDFKRRKKDNDPVVSDKTRLLYFNNKGVGPCRQGQFSDTHKLFLHQTSNTKDNEEGCRDKDSINSYDPIVQFVIGEEKKGFDIGVDEWVLARAHQSIILHGVLHELYFLGGSLCRDYDEYITFRKDYIKFKKELYEIIEYRMRPSYIEKLLVNYLGDVPALGPAIKYYTYKLNAKPLAKTMRNFVGKWIEAKDTNNTKRTKIYVEGEIYMRGAQAETIFDNLLVTLGFGRFNLKYSPVWNYIQYMIEEKIHECKGLIHKEKNKLQICKPDKRKEHQKLIRENERKLSKTIKFRRMLRDIMAKPLYEYANIEMPDLMENVLQEAKEIVPNLVPQGELSIYVGEALLKLRKGYDLFLNVAPEGCMVSSMSEVLSPKIMKSAGNVKGKIQHLFSSDGDLNTDLLELALLKTMGPVEFYSRH